MTLRFRLPLVVTNGAQQNQVSNAPLGLKSYAARGRYPRLKSGVIEITSFQDAVAPLGQSNHHDLSDDEINEYRRMVDL